AVGVLVGMGLYLGSAMCAVAVVSANVLLRPSARRVRKHSAATAEIEVTYRIRVVCKESQSTHVRAMLLQALSDTEFTVHSVESEEHTSELQSRFDLVCRLLLATK